MWPLKAGSGFGRLVYASTAADTATNNPAPPRRTYIVEILASIISPLELLFRRPDAPETHMVSTRADPAPESFPPRIGCLVPRSERRLRATPHGRDAAVAVVSGGPNRSRTNKNQDCPQTSHCLFHQR